MTGLDNLPNPAGEGDGATAANKIEYDAHGNAVSAVTIFQTNTAEIKRKIMVDLKDGHNDVEVINLPTCLEANSIRVDGVGNATILDVIYHPAPPVDRKKFGESIKELEARKRSIQSELDIITSQTKLLAQYSKSLTGDNTSSDQLDNFLDAYAARQGRCDSQKFKLEKDMAAVHNEINEKSVTFNIDAQSLQSRGVSIAIVVLAEGDGPAEIALTYVVSKAWWSPQYDLRAHIDADEPKSGSDSEHMNTVSLHYRAAIRQQTGEDWSGVALTLSTASPMRGSAIPTLKPQSVAERQKVTYNPPKKRLATKAARRVLGHPQAPGSDDDDEDEDDEDALEETAETIRGDSIAPRALLQVRGAAANEGATSTTFTIPGLSNIPSDTNAAQQTHKVSIAELEFSSVDLEWITVPKEAQSAFLRCKFKNTTNYLLLLGSANVFLNSNFVAKSMIPHVSPQESFSCSLGVDPAIRVTYHPQTRKVRSSASSLLSSNKSRITTFEQAIRLRNTRLARVHRLLIKEQIPTSSDDRIKVNLLEPRAFAKGAVKEGGVQVAEGVKVRWSSRKDCDAGDGGKVGQEELTADSARGLMEWAMEIEPGASVDVNLSWEIIAPADLDWTMQ